VFIHRAEHHADYVPLPDEIHASEVPKAQAVAPACVLADGLFRAIGHPTIDDDAGCCFLLCCIAIRNSANYVAI
jgi:hypothetical protein